MGELETAVTQHYAGDGAALQRILDAIVAAGLDPDALEPDALAGVDEFHLGGRAATEALIADLGLSEGSRVLDVGCGIGGAARTLSNESGCTVVGIDLTPEFVEAATALSERTGLTDRTSFRVGSALSLEIEPGSFDAVTLLHVGMNIEDKAALMAELAGAVRAGGQVAVYDVMRVGDGDITYPVPWAGEAASSFVARPEDYVAAMRSAGLEPGEPVGRGPLVAAFVQATQESPPPVNLQALVGPDFPVYFGNLVQAIQGGVVAPMQIIARKP